MILHFCVIDVSKEDITIDKIKENDINGLTKKEDITICHFETDDDIVQYDILTLWPKKLKETIRNKKSVSD